MTGLDIALDAAGAVYIAGSTSSTSFPTVDPLQQSFGGGFSDLFLIKIADPAPPVDLGLTKSVSQTSAVVGETLTYTLVVTNSDTNAASGVTLQDPLPPGLTIVTIAAVPSGSCTDQGNGQVDCDLAVLQPGDIAVVVITATATASGQFCNSATVSGANVLPVSAEACTTVVEAGNPPPAPLPSLSVTKAGPVAVGTDEDLVYTVTITNTGSVPTPAVVLTDSVGEAKLIQFQGLMPSAGTCELVGESPFDARCELGDLDPGGSVTVVIHARSTDNPGVVENQASVTTPALPPGNYVAAVATTTVGGPSADLAVDIQGPIVTDGGATAYPVTVTETTGVAGVIAWAQVFVTLGIESSLPVPEVAVVVAASGDPCAGPWVPGGLELAGDQWLVSCTLTDLPTTVSVSLPSEIGVTSIRAEITGPVDDPVATNDVSVWP